MTSVVSSTNEPPPEAAGFAKETSFTVAFKDKHGRDGSNKGFRANVSLLVSLLLSVPWHVAQVVSLTRDLLGWLLAGPTAWISMTMRLLAFTFLLLPGWIRLLHYYLFSKEIIHNVAYSELGARSRNLLDIYLPNASSSSSSGGGATPVVIFVSGGAWIIGYKLWSAIVARSMASMGVLVVCIDYRNFPQGDIEDMAADVRAAVAWTASNCERWGGSPERIVLAGQSAGAHICLSVLLDAFETQTAATSAPSAPSATAATGTTATTATATTAIAATTVTPARLHPLTRQTLRQLEAVSGGALLPTPHQQHQQHQQDSPEKHQSGRTWRDIPTPTPTKLSKAPLSASPTTRPSSPHKSHPLNLSLIKLFVGVSGPYDLVALADHLHGRGLDASILAWICRGDLEQYSPTRRVLRAIAARGGVTPVDQHCPSASSSAPSPSPSRPPSPSPSDASGYGLCSLPFASFPPCALFHGEKDVSVPPASSADLASCLAAGGTVVHCKVYPGLSHTDPILEGPLSGDGTLMVDIVERVHAATGTSPRVWEEIRAGLGRRGKEPAMVRPALVKIARMVNPF